MPSTPSGTAVENSINGGSILYSDTGSYATVSSRILTVYNYLGAVVQTFNMGSNLTQQFTFTADDWYWFQCVVVDNTGTWTTNVYVVAQGFFWVAYQNQYNANNCASTGVNMNLEAGTLALNSALRANLSGQSGAAVAHRNIVAANYFVNQSVTLQYS
jgi:hypothetical protein